MRTKVEVVALVVACLIGIGIALVYVRTLDHPVASVFPATKGDIFRVHERLAEIEARLDDIRKGSAH